MTKRGISLILVCAMMLNMTMIPSYAWSLGGFVKDVGNTIGEGVDAVGDGISDGVDAVGDATNFVIENSDLITGELGRLVDKGYGWAKNATGDAAKWLSTASGDAIGWLDGAVEDVLGFLNDFAKGIKGYRRADKPNINGLYQDISQVASSEEITQSYVNVLNENTGYFGEMINVKERQLPKKAQDEIKNKLNSVLSNYWSNFAVSKISGASEGTSIGDIVESIIPFDFILNGMVADEIDEIVDEYGFETIDKTKKIIPENVVNGLEYKFTVDKLDQLSGPSVVMFKGIVSVGHRDHIEGKFIAGGKEYAATAFVENNRVGFYARVEDVSNLSFVFINKFEKPQNFPLEIAKGFQKTVNDISPFGSPISNKAARDIAEFLGDTETVYKSTTKDKNGNKKTDVKKMPSVNEFYASGDAGMIVSNIIYTIPVIGDVIALLFKSTGNDETLANIIRDIVDQKEVKSFLRIENPELLIERSIFEYEEKQLTKFEASINGQSYNNLLYYGSSATKTMGNFELAMKLPQADDITISGNYKGQLALVTDTQYSPVVADEESTFVIHFDMAGYQGKEGYVDYGNVSLIFGVQNVSFGNDQYNGQCIGFADKTDEIFYGRANYNWSHKASSKVMTLGTNHKLKVSVKREKNGHKAYVWFDGISYGSYTLEDYTPGFFGVRTYESDFTVSSIIVKPTVEENIQKPFDDSNEVITTKPVDPNLIKDEAGNKTENEKRIDEIVFVNSSDWAVPEMKNAVKSKLVKDYIIFDDCNSNISRRDFSEIAVNLYEALSGESITPAADSTFTDSMDPFVLKAYEAGIVGGMGDGTFEPNASLDREQMAIMFKRIIDNVHTLKGKSYERPTGDFAITDSNQVSEWAKESVEFVYLNDIIVGDGVSYNPKGTAPVEQAIAIVNRVYDKYKDSFVESVENDIPASDGIVGILDTKAPVNEDLLKEEVAKEVIIASDFSVFPNAVTHDGSYTGNRAYGSSIYGTPLKGADSLLIFNDKTMKDGTVKTDITLYDPIDGNKYANAGLVFRVTDPKAGSNNFKGYYVGLRVSANDLEGGIMIGKMNDGEWKNIQEIKSKIFARQNYELKAVLKGTKIDVYMDDKLIMTVDDSTYSDGNFGFRSYKLPAIYQNISVE